MLTECRLGFARSFSAVAAAAALLFFASPAPAQGSSPAEGDEWAPIDATAEQRPPANQEMQVIAPDLRGAPLRLQRPNAARPFRMATEVRYDDLDLRTPQGAQALRARVRSAARDVCEQLAAAYPVYEKHLTSCSRAAERNAGLRANSIINNAAQVQKP